MSRDEGNTSFPLPDTKGYVGNKTSTCGGMQGSQKYAHQLQPHSESADLTWIRQVLTVNITHGELSEGSTKLQNITTLS